MAKKQKTLRVEGKLSNSLVLTGSFWTCSAQTVSNL